MYSELKGKVALITGSTIETESRLKNYGFEFIIQKADVSDPAAIRELFTVALEYFGKLDIIIANAGAELIERAVIDSTEEDYPSG